jgi:Tol biopolymer transport system component
LIVDHAAAAGRSEPIDRANGGLIDWPGGAAHYGYGAYFHQYLADRFGPASLGRLSDETARRLPYFSAPAFRAVFGRPLGSLWDDFEADTSRRARLEETAAVRLTHHGFSVAAPRFSASGRLFYSIVNPHGFPAIMELPRDGGRPRQIATKYLGGHIAASAGSLVFDQLEVARNVGLQADLFTVPQDGVTVWRLTHGARAADPDVSPDGQTIVCTVQSADRRALATLPVPPPGTIGQPATLISEEGTDFAAPRWSPDGRWIAAERRRLGGPSEIVVIDAASRRARAIVASTGARNVSPVWVPDGSAILFASDRGGTPFAIYSANVATGAVRRLNGAGASAQAPALSPDGREIVYVGYTADGYDLFSIPLASATWTDVSPAAVARGGAPPAPSASPATLAAPAYRPWRTLAPRFWLPFVESDAGEVGAGAGTAGSDALGRHGYAGSATWFASRLRPDIALAYAYDRWRPTLFASLSDDTDPWRDGQVRTLELNAGALFSVRRVRWMQAFLTAFSGSSDLFECPSCEPAVDELVRRRAIRFGWRFENARSYGYSISRETGVSIRATSETTRRTLGADGNAAALTLDVRAYRPGPPRHGALALRAAVATSWGDDRVRRTFSAAGAGPQSGGFDFGSDAIGLLRGFDAASVTGTHALVGNLDYRFPLLRIQRGAGTLPLFIRTVHGAVFADAGNAWSGTFRWKEARTSLGAELSLDSVVGYALPLTFAAGAAWRDDPDAARRGVVAFGRIGRAF